MAHVVRQGGGWVFLDSDQKTRASCNVLRIIPQEVSEHNLAFSPHVGGALLGVHGICGGGWDSGDLLAGRTGVQTYGTGQRMDMTAAIER